jgi:hypothetical protein
MGKFDLQKYISQSPLLEGINHIPNSEEDGKTIYKSYLLEGLTTEEADSFREKYKKRYAAILKSNPDFIKKYPNPDAVVHGMVVKEIVKLREKLNSSDPIEKYVDDFQNSNARQFQNKSKEEINKMAQAAYFSKTKNEQMKNSRLQELVKKALSNPISEKVEFTDKHDDDKGLKGKQKNLPDNIQAKILNKEDLDFTTKQKAVTAQSITGLPSFAQQILDYIYKIEQIEGKGYINNGKIQNIIKQLQSLNPVENKSLSERIFKELREDKFKLTPAEQEIFDDITSSLNEGMFDNVLEKIKKYSRKGLITAGLLLALSNMAFSAEQQEKIDKVLDKTEIPASEKGGIDRMHKISVVTTALQQYKRGKKLDKLDDFLKQDLEAIKNGPEDVDQVVDIFDSHQDALKDYVSFMF